VEYVRTAKVLLLQDAYQDLDPLVAHWPFVNDSESVSGVPVQFTPE